MRYTKKASFLDTKLIPFFKKYGIFLIALFLLFPYVYKYVKNLIESVRNTNQEVEKVKNANENAKADPIIVKQKVVDIKKKYPKVSQKTMNTIVASAFKIAEAFGTNVEDNHVLLGGIIDLYNVAAWSEDEKTAIRIPEELIFCNLRQGISFIREPHRCIDFTHTERLIMASEFTDTEMLKDADYRKENSYLNPLCQIEIYNFTLADADVKYFYDEGNVLIFPLNVGIPNMLTNVWLSYDGINWQRAGIEHDDNGFEWPGGPENRLYYTAINGILFPSVDLANAAFIDLPKYAFFENAETLGRSKVHTITIV